MIDLKEDQVSQGRYEKAKAIRSGILIELERLQKDILEKKGREREKAMESYRELLHLMRDEPIYISKY